MNGIDIKITDHSDEVLKALHSTTEKLLEEIGLFVEGEAKEALEMSPRRIDTGLLRNSITHAVSGKTPAQTSYSADTGGKSGSYSGSAPADDEEHMAVYVGTNVEYAPYVHEGTRKMAPNRFLKNAVEMNADQIKEKIEQGLKNA